MGKAIGNNLHTCCVFLDFSKAFDNVNHQLCVNHEILLSKLEAYGKRDSFKLVLPQPFKRYVELNGIEPPKQTISCSIPQGIS